jgi:hypothetical protein
MAKQKRHTGRRAYSDDAELKYRGIRAGLSPMTFYMGRVLDQQLKMHLGDKYRNEAETEATLKLTGYLQALKTSIKLTATRADMQKFYRLAEKMRWDKGFALSREDAVANLFSRGFKKPKAIKLGSRPAEFRAKPTTPYTPRPGSSKGKIGTKQVGARRVQQNFDKLLKALFSIGGKFNKPKVSVRRTIQKTLNLKE